METRLFVLGYFGFGNAGDDAIGVAIAEYLADQEGAEDLLISQGPKSIEVSESIQRIPFSSVNVLAEAVRSDEVIITGGTHFHDHGRDFGKSLKIHLFYLIAIVVSRLTGGRTHLLGHGFGPFTRRTSKFLTALALRFATSVSVRDPQSQDVTQDLGTSSHLGFDLACLFGGQGNSDDGQSVVLGISVTPAFDKYHDSPERDRLLVEDLAESINNYSDQGQVKKVRVFSLHNGDENGDDDISQSLCSLLDNEADVVQYENDPKEFLREVSGVDCMIGMKYHSLVFGYLCSIPTAAVSYHPKCRHFQEYVGRATECETAMTESNVETIDALISCLIKSHSCCVAQLSVEQAKSKSEDSLSVI